MPPHLGILPREPLDLIGTQMSPQPCIEFPGEVIVEFGEEFNVEEEDGRGG